MGVQVDLRISENVSGSTRKSLAGEFTDPQSILLGAYSARAVDEMKGARTSCLHRRGTLGCVRTSSRLRVENERVSSAGKINSERQEPQGLEGTIESRTMIFTVFVIRPKVILSADMVTSMIACSSSVDVVPHDHFSWRTALTRALVDFALRILADRPM
ncbi:unnamed protein product [Blumeria hordei]|uniref:Uncharacterized protein n=2 Tax=Blumeria hordei TaxID=2867405 RepID=A0A383UNT6_BLUHO|nr:hypothetical protein BGHDH14_bghG000351000001001 [Blumeria hordei DH14]SZF01010.1 unnamed protein product [Blumeria hordei]